VEPSLDTGAVDVFVGVFTGDPGPRPEAMLEKIDCPVLVAWGEADPWTPLDGQWPLLYVEPGCFLSMRSYS